MRSALTTRRRVTAGLAAGTLLLAACGGSDDAGSGAVLPEVDESSGIDAQEPDSSTDAAAPAAEGSGLVDLGGPDVNPASDFEANLLPSVVVDDLNSGRKVNFRNLVPQEKPILLWMWAPH